MITLTVSRVDVPRVLLSHEVGMIGSCTQVNQAHEMQGVVVWLPVHDLEPGSQRAERSCSQALEKRGNRPFLESPVQTESIKLVLPLGCLCSNPVMISLRRWELKKQATFYSAGWSLTLRPPSFLRRRPTLRRRQPPSFT
jgi:hypothetical protein